MSLTWGMVRDKLRRAILDVVEGGADSSPQFSNEDLADFWTDAQDYLVDFAARMGTFTVLKASDMADLPDDVYRIVAVKNAAGYTMLPVDMDDEDDADHWTGCYWYLFNGQLRFTVALDAEATVYYQAFYPAIRADDADMPILVPRWSLRALIYHCTAQAIERYIVEDPGLRRWASKQTDAGTPKDNPFIQVAKYFLERCREVVYAHVGDAKEHKPWPSLYR